MEKVRDITEKVEVLSEYTPYWGIPSGELKNQKWEVSVFSVSLL